MTFCLKVSVLNCVRFVTSLIYSIQSAFEALSDTGKQSGSSTAYVTLIFLKNFKFPHFLLCDVCRRFPHSFNLKDNHVTQCLNGSNDDDDCKVSQLRDSKSESSKKRASHDFRSSDLLI